MKIQVNYQILSVGFSFLLHLMFILLIVYLTSTITQRSKTIVLDFSLENIIKTGEHHTDTKPTKITEATEKKKQSTANDEKITKKILGDRIFDERTDKFETVPVSTIEEDGRKATATKNQKIKTIINEKPISAEAVKETITVLPETHKHLEVKDNLNNNLTEEIRKNVHDTTYEIQEVTIENTQKPTAKHQIKNHSYSPPSPPSSAQSTSPLSPPSQEVELGEVDVEQNAENQYIKEHFDYISKIIRLNISYPNKARKMSMEGNVIISFIVYLDGSVKDVKIEKSSGFSILDNNAEKAIRKASPFPPPPVEVKIVIPITYKIC